VGHGFVAANDTEPSRPNRRSIFTVTGQGRKQVPDGTAELGPGAILETPGPQRRGPDEYRLRQPNTGVKVLKGTTRRFVLVAMMAILSAPLSLDTARAGVTSVSATPL